MSASARLQKMFPSGSLDQRRTEADISDLFGKRGNKSEYGLCIFTGNMRMVGERELQIER